MFFFITIVPYTPCANIPSIPLRTQKSLSVIADFPVSNSEFVIHIISPPSCSIVHLGLRFPSLLWSILPLPKLNKKITTDMAHHMVCDLFPKGWGFLGRTTQPRPNLFVHIIIDSSNQKVRPGMKLVYMLAFYASTNFRTWKNLSI